MHPSTILHVCGVIWASESVCMVEVIIFLSFSGTTWASPWKARGSLRDDTHLAAPFVLFGPWPEPAARQHIEGCLNGAWVDARFIWGVTKNGNWKNKTKQTEKINSSHYRFSCWHAWIFIHTSSRVSIFHFTPRLEILKAVLCCSCWFRLLLPLAGSKPAVTLTLALQICSVQQNLDPSPPSFSLSYRYMLTRSHILSII